MGVSWVRLYGYWVRVMVRVTIRRYFLSFVRSNVMRLKDATRFDVTTSSSAKSKIITVKIYGILLLVL